MLGTEEIRLRYRWAEPEYTDAMLSEIPQRGRSATDEMANSLEFLVGEGAMYLTGQN